MPTKKRCGAGSTALTRCPTGRRSSSICSHAPGVVRASTPRSPAARHLAWWTWLLCGRGPGTRSRCRARLRSSDCCGVPGCPVTRPGWSLWPARSAACGWPGWRQYWRSLLWPPPSGTPAACGSSSPWRPSCRASRWPSAMTPRWTRRSNRNSSRPTRHSAWSCCVRSRSLRWLVPGQAPFRWLLPAVGFAAAVLALSTWTSPLRAAIGVSAAWLVVVLLLVTQAGSPDAVLRARFQACYLLLAAASGVIFLVRRRRLRELRPRGQWL